MKRIILCAVCLLAALGCGGRNIVENKAEDAEPQQVVVKTGIEVLRETGIRQLEGKRIALVTNPSGVDRNLVSTIDILAAAPNVQLVALFGPEHGVRGDEHAGSQVGDSVDPKTGIKVYSIYGATRKPTPAMLSGIDAVVYDIQDNGSRSFTFISTLGLVMQACAELDKEVIVLDRPNPLGGLKIEGSYVEPGRFSFVSQYKIPYIYGLTVGELATLINEEGLNRGQKGTDAPCKCRLTVVQMEGWHREMNYTATGLPWVLQSPHIPNAETSYFYPATGMAGELSWMSIGVGYTMPFQLFGAEWVTAADKLCAKLNALELEGVRFREIHYKPYYGYGKDKQLHGVQIYFTDYQKARLTEIQFHVMQVVSELYPTHKPFGADASKYAMFDKVMGSSKIREMFSKTNRFDSIRDFWRKDEEHFRELSQRYYLYR